MAGIIFATVNRIYCFHEALNVQNIRKTFKLNESLQEGK